MNNNQINILISDEKINFRATESHYHKSISIANQLRLKEFLSEDLKFKDLASDIKLFISHHIKSLDESEVHYDQIQLDLIFEFIEKLPAKERLLLSKYTLKELKRFGHEEHLNKCVEKCNEYELNCLKIQKGLKSAIKQIYLHSIRSNWTILFSLILFYILYSIVLLPAPIKWMEFYKIEYVEIYPHLLANHFSNTLLGIFDLNDDFKVVPNNFLALISMVCAKIIFLIYIVKVLTEELIKKINK